MSVLQLNSVEILNHLYDGVYQVDPSGSISFWNTAAERISGFTREEVLGKPCAASILLCSGEEAGGLCDDDFPLQKTLADGLPRERTLYIHHKKGHRLPVAARTSQTRDEDGRIAGAIMIFRDASDLDGLRKRVQDLERLAYLDPLTELANRRYVEIALRQRLEELKRYGWSFGLFLADVDCFKAVNDEFGHQAGDQLLTSVARTMSLHLRPFDMVGRWGGDEFVGVLRNVERSGLGETIDRLRILIKDSALNIDGVNVRATVSFGCTLARRADSAEDLISRADHLLYASKRGGKNRTTLDAAMVH